MTEEALWQYVHSGSFDPIAVAINAYGPTDNGPSDLPDQVGPRYPLMEVDRAHVSTLALLRHWLALLWWRWLTRRS